jgi:hypothetical protein
MERLSEAELQRLSWGRHPLSEAVFMGQVLMGDGPDSPSEYVLFFSNGQSIAKRKLENELQAIYDSLVLELYGGNDGE